MTHHRPDPRQVLAESSEALADIRDQLNAAFPDRNEVSHMLRDTRRSLRHAGRQAGRMVNNHKAEVSLGGLLLGALVAGAAYAMIRGGSDRPGH